MNKKATLLKAAIGIYRVKSAESRMPDPFRAKLEAAANKSSVLAALRGAVLGSAAGYSAGGLGAGILGIGASAPYFIRPKNGIANAMNQGAMLTAPFGGVLGGVLSYRQAEQEIQEARDALAMEDWAAQKEKEENQKNGIDD